MQILSNVHLKLSQIRVDQAFNARKNYSGIQELAKEIKRDGQINPCIVTQHGCAEGEYFLVAGFRRFAALEILSDVAKGKKNKCRHCQ